MTLWGGNSADVGYAQMELAGLLYDCCQLSGQGSWLILDVSPGMAHLARSQSRARLGTVCSIGSIDTGLKREREAYKVSGGLTQNSYNLISGALGSTLNHKPDQIQGVGNSPPLVIA